MQNFIILFLYFYFIFYILPDCSDNTKNMIFYNI